MFPVLRLVCVGLVYGYELNYIWDLQHSIFQCVLFALDADGSKMAFYSFKPFAMEACFVSTDGTFCSVSNQLMDGY